MNGLGHRPTGGIGVGFAQRPRAGRRVPVPSIPASHCSFPQSDSGPGLSERPVLAGRMMGMGATGRACLLGYSGPNDRRRVGGDKGVPATGRTGRYKPSSDTQRRSKPYTHTSQPRVGGVRLRVTLLRSASMQESNQWLDRHDAGWLGKGPRSDIQIPSSATGVQHCGHHRRVLHCPG